MYEKVQYENLINIYYLLLDQIFLNTFKKYFLALIILSLDKYSRY